ERGRQRTVDALARRARNGHVPNGKAFGYANEPVFDGDRRSHVRRVIVPTEAAVVSRIFDMVASGMGMRKIAATLNAEHAATPAPRRAGRLGSWSAAGVRDAVFREAYRGRLVWNRRERRAKRGVRVRPQSEWIEVNVPDLRIITDAQWQAAHDRLAASRL